MYVRPSAPLVDSLLDSLPTPQSFSSDHLFIVAFWLTLYIPKNMQLFSQESLERSVNTLGKVVT